MPTAKRVKRSAASAAKPPAESKVEQAADERPTPAEIEQEEHPFVQVARQHWLKSTKKNAKVKVKNDVLKQALWDSLEKEAFAHKPLQLLESLQTLERCAFPMEYSLHHRFEISNVSEIVTCGLATRKRHPTSTSCSLP